MSDAIQKKNGKRLWQYFAVLPIYLHHIGLGILFAPFPFIVLTTRGRRTGQARHVVLEWRRHGSRYYLVSVNGAKAAWYRNILADSLVTVQNGVKPIRARAYPVTDAAEALRALYMFRRHSPVYEYVLSRMSSAEKIDFRTLTEVAGEFTLVRLELETEAPDLPGIEGRYTQVRWLLALFPVVLWWLIRQR